MILKYFILVLWLMHFQVDAATITACVTNFSGNLHCISQVNGVMDASWDENITPADYAAMSGNRIIVTNANKELLHGEIGVHSFTKFGHGNYVSMQDLQVCTFMAPDAKEFTLTCTDDYTATPVYWFTLNGRPDYAARRISAINGIHTGKNQYAVSMTGDLFGPYISNADDDYLVQVSTDGVTFCGVTINNDGHCAYSGYPDNPVFTALSGVAIKHIAVQGHLIFIIKSDFSVHYSTNPPGAWTDLSMSALTISASAH